MGTDHKSIVMKTYHTTLTSMILIIILYSLYHVHATFTTTRGVAQEIAGGEAWVEVTMWRPARLRTGPAAAGGCSPRERFAWFES